jgi:dipeptidyl-peptidase-4
VSDDVPARYVQTGRFTFGVPRAVQLSDDDRRVLFLRSTAADDSVHSLWCLDVPGGTETLVCDPRALGDDTGDLPSEERARRERARESGGGIVAYSATPDLSRACFALYGKVFVVDVAAGGAAATEVPIAGPVIDPRLAASGDTVAFVRDRQLWLTDLDGNETRLAADPDPDVSWGLAEHVAGEEMDRMRGHWWAPDSGHLLAARVDESMVTRWYVADPEDPSAAPGSVRYPAAGAENAVVALALITRDGTHTTVTWDNSAFPYLAAVSFRTDTPLLLVQSRDQRSTQVLAVDRTTGATTLRRADHDPQWVELVPGTPDLTPDGRVVTVSASCRNDTYSLLFDDVQATPDGLQVRSVRGITGSGVVVVASREPTQTQLYRVRWDGTLDELTSAPGLHDAVVGAEAVAVHVTGLDRTLARWRLLGPEGPDIGCVADEPDLTPRVTLQRAGDLALACAVLYPREHRPGTALPVILDPYGGPHAQRVLARRAGYLMSQWIADQGFAVVVIDGRGTPGRGPVWDRAIHGDLATAPLADQIDGLAALAAEHPDLDLARVGIRGWSFGGYLALLAVLRRPDVIKAAVAGAPVTEWRYYDTHYTERYLGRPDTDTAAYDASSVLPDADKLTGALQIVHGLNDDNVFVRHSVELSRELFLHGKAHNCLLLPGITHMQSDPALYTALLRREIDFFRDALA